MCTARRLLSLAAVAAGLAVPAQAHAIVGGTNAAQGEFPAVAKVNIANAFGCTGTLIAPQWVLTAGHCGSLTGEAVASPADYPPQAMTVTLAGIRADATDGEATTVDEVTTPPEYLATKGYDIALMHLAAPAKAAPTPIAGKGFTALWAPNALEQIVGFGTTSSGGSAPPILQKAKVPVVADATCATAYPSSTAPLPVGTDGFEAGTQLCAGFPQGGTDTCQGDSGGPLFGTTGAGLRLLVGATSYGDGCADPAHPGVYARVADATLRDGFLRDTAPEAIYDAPAGAVTTPAEVYDPKANTVSPGTPASGSAPPAGGGTATAPGTTSTTAPGGASGGGDAATPTPSSGAGSPAAGAPAGPSGTATRGGFHASLAADRTLRRTLAGRGVRVRLRCSAACTTVVRLKVDPATAQALHLGSRTVGSVKIKRAGAGRTTTVVKLAARTRARVAAARKAMFMVTATVTETGGSAQPTLSAPAIVR